MQKKSITRRDALKIIASTSGVLTAAAFLPEKWTKPVLRTGVMPVHAAQSTPPTQGVYELRIHLPDADNTSNCGTTGELFLHCPGNITVLLTDENGGPVNGVEIRLDIYSEENTANPDDSDGQLTQVINNGNDLPFQNPPFVWETITYHGLATQLTAITAHADFDGTGAVDGVATFSGDWKFVTTKNIIFYSGQNTGTRWWAYAGCHDLNVRSCQEFFTYSICGY